MSDKAGKQYWERVWTGRQLPLEVEPDAPGWKNHLTRARHRLFSAAFAGIATQGKRLLEVGAGRSIWLPYFAKQFGFEVVGLDYSEVGCAQAKAILQRENVAGEVVCADLFSPLSDLLASFDLVVSLGVIEHFYDTSDAIKALGRFLKPGGMMLTVIPNMSGWSGALQKLAAPEVYDVHVTLDRETLLNAHIAAGMNVRSCEYFMFANPGVVNPGEGNKLFWNAALYVAARVLEAAQRLDPGQRMLKPNRRTSPYVSCIAVKPTTGS